MKKELGYTNTDSPKRAVLVINISLVAGLLVTISLFAFILAKIINFGV